MHRKSSYSKHGNCYKGRWKHPLMKSRLRLSKLLSFRPSMNTVLALVFEAIAAPQTAQAPVTRKSTETRNSFKYAADDESVYTAAKYSKMPQCFAYIRGVWGFIDRVTWLTHSRKVERGLHESNTSKQRSRASLNLLMSKKRGN